MNIHRWFIHARAAPVLVLGAGVKAQDREQTGSGEAAKQPAEGKALKLPARVASRFRHGGVAGSGQAFLTTGTNTRE
jgi:hypothetical protein